MTVALIDASYLFRRNWHAQEHTGERDKILARNALVAGLIDWCHENQPLEQALDWPGRVARSLQPGADTTHVIDKWFVWLLTEDLKPLDADGVCAKMGALFARRIAGDEPSETQWSEAARAAGEAGAAGAAGEAWAAREAGEARAAGAAGEAWEAWEAARFAFAIRAADKLIEIMEGCR